VFERIGKISCSLGQAGAEGQGRARTVDGNGTVVCHRDLDESLRHKLSLFVATSNKQ